MDLGQAIQAHGEWKAKFRTAIAAGQQMDAATISADNRCPLGQWLHGEARIKFGALPSLAECVAAHASFHKEAGRVAEAINGKKYAAAGAMLDAGTPYATVSNAVGMAIMRLRKEAGL